MEDKRQDVNNLSKNGGFFTGFYYKMKHFYIKNIP